MIDIILVIGIFIVFSVVMSFGFIFLFEYTNRRDFLKIINEGKKRREEQGQDECD